MAISSDNLAPAAVWLVAAERIGDAHWTAQLELNNQLWLYELEILPGPLLHEIVSPDIRLFHGYRYDLTRLLLRMQNGERFMLPFQLRPRWPTPPDPPSDGQ
jgi:hypothetical protein